MKEGCSIAISVAAFVLAVVLTIGFYILARKRYAHSKIWVEIVFIAVALTASLLVKAHILVSGVSDGIPRLSAFYDSLYKAIGGLTFEGVSPADESGIDAKLLALYYGSSLYAGLVTIFIISVKASFEFYSIISVIISPRKNIYIITDLSEETLALAKNIEKTERESGSGCRIVFAGPRLQAFDRHNELCQQVMANNFLYWSYSRAGHRYKRIGDKGGNGGGATRGDGANNAQDSVIRDNKSIAARLGIGKIRKAVARRIAVFAFAASDHIPLEAENINTVCDDIRARIRKKDALRIEYVLLTKEGIDYSAYDQMRADLIWEFGAKYRDDIAKALNREPDEDDILREFSSRFVIDCWCESETIGRQAFARMAECGFDRELASDNNEPLYIWSLGFGARGQAVAQELFVQSANINRDGASRKCLIDVFDKDAENAGGRFRYEHQDFLFLTESDANYEAFVSKYEEMLRGILDISETDDDLKRDLEQAAVRHIEAIGAPLYYVTEKDAGANRFMPRPVFRFHNVDCEGFGFFSKIDRETGIDCGRSAELIRKLSREFIDVNAGGGETLRQLFTAPFSPKAIIVATGDDDSNLRIANALIRDIIIEHNTGKTKESESQYLIVNITDKNNNVRLIKGDGKWDAEKCVLRFDFGLTVIVVGNFKDIFAYEYTIGRKAERYYHYLYENIGKIISSDNDGGEGSELHEYIGKAQIYLKKNASPEGEAFVNYFAAAVREALAEADISAASAEGLKNGDGIPSKRLNDLASGVKKIIDERCRDLNTLVNGLKMAGGCVKGMKANALPAEIYERYDRIDIWKRRSNVSAAAFAPVMAAIAEADRSIDYARLSRIEHDRWVRLHLAYGWAGYTGTKDKNDAYKSRLHRCVCAYSDVPDKNLLYDTVNVIMALGGAAVKEPTPTSGSFTAAISSRSGNDGDEVVTLRREDQALAECSAKD